MCLQGVNCYLESPSSISPDPGKEGGSWHTSQAWTQLPLICLAGAPSPRRTPRLRTCSFRASMEPKETHSNSNSIQVCSTTTSPSVSRTSSASRSAAGWKAECDQHTALITSNPKPKKALSNYQEWARPIRLSSRASSAFWKIHDHQLKVSYILLLLFGAGGFTPVSCQESACQLFIHSPRDLKMTDIWDFVLLFPTTEWLIQSYSYPIAK